ncbi:unnamed protein product [Withania somnifera]
MTKTCLLILSLGFLSYFRAAFCCPNDKKQALLNSKSAFLENTAVNSSSSGGSFSNGIEDWNSTSDCCSCTVIALYLDSFQSESVVISSSLLAPLFGIKSLRKLILSTNHIQGQIPGEGLANIVNLVHVDLMQNNFTGPIAPPIFHLRHLQYLDLSENLLTGVLNPEIRFLQEFRTLKLDENLIGGNIPTEIGNFSKIQELSLRNNHFSGGIPLLENLFSLQIPTEIGRLSNLSNLALSKNKLTGVIPSSIQNMTKLESLKLDNSMLTGEIPSWLLNVKALKNLLLGENGLKRNNNVNTVPQCTLSELSLQFCGLVGPIPGWISSQRSLKQVLRELPENRGNATGIMILILAENSFSGKIPRSITNIDRLLLLDLSKNRLSGTIPVLDPTSYLANVDLSLNDFSGKFPLGGNNFTGGLARNLTVFYMLERLDLHDNRITGELPNFISEMSTLRSLNLRNNSIQGSVPSSISNLSNLQILNLSHNSFTGSIPIEVGNLVGMIETPSTFSSISYIFKFSIEYTDLLVNWKRSIQSLSSNASINIWLDLSKNNLSDEIPSSLGKLRGLKGKATLGNLKSLESIDLSHNSFSVPIPQSFTRLQQLTVLDVSNNHLKGKIPVGGQMDTMDDPAYYAYNSGLCGFQIQNESKESWFAWEAMWIGLPFGFIVSMLVILLTGFCELTEQLSHLLRRQTRS